MSEPSKSKNIVLLSDGTGNSSAKQFKTNVWRLFQVLDLKDPAAQIACYDNGVGTSSFRPLALLAEVFGFGLKRNVIDLYSFCCRNWKEGDRIYCFGFSRGAFTIRIVAGIIASQGLVNHTGNDQELDRYAADAYRNYRRRFNTTGRLVSPIRWLRDKAINAWRWSSKWVSGIPVKDPNPKRTVDAIHFVGLWDTVDAYGGPIEEVTRAIDYWIWPLSMPDRFMSAKVHRACHALALEDERDAFRPVIWDERYVRDKDDQLVQSGRRLQKSEWLYGADHHSPSASGRPLEIPPHLRNDLPEIDRQRISQVWFTGVHADIGGGYPQDGLSFVTLDWMMDRATAYGLKILDLQRRLLISPQVNPYDLLNDSRSGLAGYYRYKPRNIADIYGAAPYKPSIWKDILHLRDLIQRRQNSQRQVQEDLHPSLGGQVLPPSKAVIHQSVFDRIAQGNDQYAPVILPRDYCVTDKAGSLALARPATDTQPHRSTVQNSVWNWIWLRRVVYFLTIFASIFVAAIPYLVIYAPGFGDRSVGNFIRPILSAAASFLPGFLTPWFDAAKSAPGFVLVGAIAISSFLYIGRQLQVSIRDRMRTGWNTALGKREALGWESAVFRTRSSGWYRAFFYVLKTWILPTAIIFWFASWLFFGTANTLGLVCKGKGGPQIETSEQLIGEMRTDVACNPTGFSVTQGETYQIRLRVTQPWLDAKTPASPNGFGRDIAPIQQQLGFQYRRLIWSNWFAIILRVGGSGFEEHLLDLKAEGVVWTATFKARSTGEVFLYVNDAVIGLPFIYDFFYWLNNEGAAEVRLSKIS